jgi:hypothetical protein
MGQDQAWIPALCSSPVDAHTDCRHALFPNWLRSALVRGDVPRGKWAIVGDDLIAYLPCGVGESHVFIWNKGVFATHFPCTKRQLEGILIERLERFGWRALWRLPQTGKHEVLGYLGLSPAHGTLAPAVAEG